MGIALYIKNRTKKTRSQANPDMFPLFEVHLKENENQDLLYPVSDRSHERPIRTGFLAFQYRYIPIYQ